MSFKQHRANAVKLLEHIEKIKEDPKLIPDDGKLETTIEIAVAKALDMTYSHGWENATQAMHVLLTRLKRQD
jgi:dTDP-4-amino-4,6-dideoxygalactose transaminase